MFVFRLTLITCTTSELHHLKMFSTEFLPQWKQRDNPYLMRNGSCNFTIASLIHSSLQLFCSALYTQFMKSAIAFCVCVVVFVCFVLLFYSRDRTILLT